MTLSGLKEKTKSKSVTTKILTKSKRVIITQKQTRDTSTPIAFRTNALQWCVGRKVRITTTCTMLCTSLHIRPTIILMTIVKEKRKRKEKKRKRRERAVKRANDKLITLIQTLITQWSFGLPAKCGKLVFCRASRAHPLLTLGTCNNDTKVKKRKFAHV
jgi:hypothetical protein